MPKKKDLFIQEMEWVFATPILYDILYDNTDNEYFQPSSDSLNIQLEGLAEIAAGHFCL